MIAFRVEDMTCGHCVSRIAKALKAVDRDAKITIDLGQRLVMVEPADSAPQDLGEAIAEAGYTPVRVQVASLVVSAPGVGGPACCGSGH